MFSYFGGTPISPARLASAQVTNTVGTPITQADVEWTYTGDVTGYSIYIAYREFPAGIGFTDAYGPLAPAAGTQTIDPTGWVGYNPAVGLNGFEIQVRLEKAGPTQAIDSPIELPPPF